MTMQNFSQYFAEFFSQHGWETLVRPGNSGPDPHGSALRYASWIRIQEVKKPRKYTVSLVEYTQNWKHKRKDPFVIHCVF